MSNREKERLTHSLFLFLFFSFFFFSSFSLSFTLSFLSFPFFFLCSQDLIRYLRRDGEVCQIRRILGEARVLQNDLVPMLKQYKDDEALFDLLVRLLVNLTQVHLLN